MKEKILTALKTRFANLGFGDKAFDGVASFLEKTVTEETQIDNAITGVEPLLKAFQGDIDKRVTSLQTELDTLKKKVPPTPPTPPVTPPDPNDIKTIVANAIKAAVEPLQHKIEGYEQRETQKTLQTRVLSTIRDGLKTDAEKKSFDIWIKGRTVSVENEDKLGDIVTSVQTGFNEFRQEMINQGIIIEVPASSKAFTGGVDDFINTMKEINKTEKVESK